MNEEIIIKKFQESVDSMFKSLKEDNLDKDEKNEWFGYIRGVRDCAYECGILQKTTIQEILEESLKLTLPSKHIN